MIVSLKFAKMSDPWWFVTCPKGFRYTMPIAIHVVTHPDGGAVLWNFIIGPACLTLGFKASNNKSTSA